MGGIVDSVFGGDDAEDAAKDAAEVSVGAQREALQYLKEREELPQEFREASLKKLAGILGLPGGDPGGQQWLISTAVGNPLYNQYMYGLRAGEDAILRNAAATGGLRSGNTSDALAKHAIDLETRALAASYADQMQNLQGLAQLPSGAGRIAETMAGMGATEAAGITAGAQARQDARKNFLNTAIGISGLFF